MTKKNKAAQAIAAARDAKGMVSVKVPLGFVREQPKLSAARRRELHIKRFARRGVVHVKGIYQ